MFLFTFLSYESKDEILTLNLINDKILIFLSYSLFSHSFPLLLSIRLHTHLSFFLLDRFCFFWHKIFLRVFLFFFRLFIISIIHKSFKITVRILIRILSFLFWALIIHLIKDLFYGNNISFSNLIVRNFILPSLFHVETVLVYVFLALVHFFLVWFNVDGVKQIDGFLVLTWNFNLLLFNLSTLRRMNIVSQWRLLILLWLLTFTLWLAFLTLRHIQINV